MKKANKPSTLSQIFLKLLNIARLYIRIQVRRFFFLPKDGKNIKFTLIEKVAGMTIFHGISKNTVDEEDLAWIEKTCTKSRPGAMATVSNENDDPHLFKIVLWNENPV